MIDVLSDFGFTVRLWETRVLDRDLLEPPESPKDRDAYIVAEPVERTWDDWPLDADPLSLDEDGILDDWGEATGAWEGHAGKLTMWLDREGAWVFVDPIQEQVIKVKNENPLMGTHYMWMARGGRIGPDADNGRIFSFRSSPGTKPTAKKFLTKSCAKTSPAIPGR